MLDHVIVTVSDFTRSIAFYEQALKPLGSFGRGQSIGAESDRAIGRGILANDHYIPPRDNACHRLTPGGYVEPGC
jgi:hypothetical protein